MDEISIEEVGQYLQNYKDYFFKAKQKCSNLSRWERHKLMSKFALFFFKEEKTIIAISK